MRKIYIVSAVKHYDSGQNYASWMQGEITYKIDEADLVVFTGGSDISPKLYKQKRHVLTSCWPSRDKYEAEAFRVAVSLKKPIIGICRGAQLACVMSGGILIQDQHNPGFLHPVKTYDGKELIFSSTHHQAAFPFRMSPEKYKILGWTENLSKHHYGQSFNEELNPPKECEIVYYPETKALGIQGHPEMILDIQETIEYCQDLLNKHLNSAL